MLAIGVVVVVVVWWPTADRSRRRSSFVVVVVRRLSSALVVVVVVIVAGGLPAIFADMCRMRASHSSGHAFWNLALSTTTWATKAKTLLRRRRQQRRRHHRRYDTYDTPAQHSYSCVSTRVHSPSTQRGSFTSPLLLAVPRWAAAVGMRRPAAASGGMRMQHVQVSGCSDRREGGRSISHESLLAMTRSGQALHDFFGSKIHVQACRRSPFGHAGVPPWMT